ncbi:MAG: ArsR/SmtB family transcription factor [Pseudomonadales bacterium]
MNLEEMSEHADEASALLKSLAHQKRLMVLCQLSEGELSVGELLATVGLSQSALSQHLARLREEGLVDTRRDAQTIYYSLADAKAKKLIECLHELFCGAKE